MARGGKREGAGRKAAWKSGPCKAVKLPIALVEDVMSYARQLDEGSSRRSPESISPVPSAGRDKSWPQVSKIVDEKQELEKQLRHAQDLLAKERKTKELQDKRMAALEAKIADAGSILRDGLTEYKKGIRKTFSVKDARSALLALGVEID